MNFAEYQETVDASLIRETDKAYLIKDNLTKGEMWLPKSQVKINEENNQFLVPTWLIDKFYKNK